MTNGETDVPLRGGRPLRFGLSPAMTSEVAYRMGADVCRLLSAQLEREIQPLVFSDYVRLEESIVQGRVDFAWMPPVSFVEVTAEGCGLLALMERAGRTAFESALVVRADSGMEHLADLRDRRAAWVDPRSSSGHVVALSAILEALDDDGTLFSAERFYGSHKSACEAVYSGKADFCATFSARNVDGAVVDGGWLKLAHAPEGELRPLEFFGPIPADALAHSAKLGESDIRTLRQVLTTLHEQEAGRQLIEEVFSAERLTHGDAENFDDLAWSSILVSRYREKHPVEG